MALISTLVDDFNDGVTDPAKWPNSFGTYSEVGGRARVACDAGFNAYSSALNYTLTESSIYLRGYAPAAGGAATEAWAQILIKSSTGGTDLGFELRALTGELVMFSRTGYFDAGAVTITYSATTHAWLRVRETGGTVFWDTSPDAATWTNRRTLASPAWVGDANLEFQLIAHRDSGTNDFAEFDNVNITGTIVALDVASETDSAETLGKTKTRSLPTGSETDTGQVLARGKQRTLTTAADVETAQAIGSRKTKPITLAFDIETAQPLGRTKAKPVTADQAVEQALAFGGSKTRPLAPAIETDTAVALASHMGDDDVDVTIGEPYTPWTVGEPQGAAWPVGAAH